MKSIDHYKAMIEDVGHLLFVFGNIDKYTTIQEMGWTLDHIHQMQVKVMNYANIAADQIKDELIGDGDEAKFIGRIKTAFFELGGDPNFAPSYFPVFDDALFEMPSKDEPDRNNETIDMLSVAYGEDTLKVMCSVKTLLEWANIIVGDVSKMLDDVSKFIGYEPQQQQPEPQPSFLLIEEVVQAFERGIEHGYMTKQDGNYKWIKDKGTLLCALIGTLLHGDEIGTDGDYKTKGGAETFPASDIEKYFGVKDISKKRYQLNGKKPPRGYETMIKKLIEQP